MSQWKTNDGKSIKVPLNTFPCSDREQVLAFFLFFFLSIFLPLSSLSLSHSLSLSLSHRLPLGRLDIRVLSLSLLYSLFHRPASFISRFSPFVHFLDIHNTCVETHSRSLVTRRQPSSTSSGRFSRKFPGRGIPAFVLDSRWSRARECFSSMNQFCRKVLLFTTKSQKENSSQKNRPLTFEIFIERKLIFILKDKRGIETRYWVVVQLRRWSKPDTLISAINCFFVKLDASYSDQPVYTAEPQADPRGTSLIGNLLCFEIK